MSRLSHEYPDDPARWGGPDLAIEPGWTWQDVVRGSRWIGDGGATWVVRCVSWRDHGMHVEIEIEHEATGERVNRYGFEWIRRAA